jgi:hypothetical protein
MPTLSYSDDFIYKTSDIMNYILYVDDWQRED